MWSKVAGISPRGSGWPSARRSPCGHCPQCQRGRENLCPDLQAIGYEVDGAFAELIRIPARALDLGNAHALPDRVTHEEAALIEPLACVLNGQNKVGLAAGKRWSSWLWPHRDAAHKAGPAARRGPGDRQRTQCRAPRHGAGGGGRCGAGPHGLRSARRCSGGNPGLGADVVICAIGIPALAAQAVGLAGKGGRISLFAGFSKGELGQLDINAIHYEELRLVGAFGLARRDYADALNMIADGRIEVASMVTHRFDLAQAAAAFRMAEGGEAMKVAILDA